MMLMCLTLAALWLPAAVAQSAPRASGAQDSAGPRAVDRGNPRPAVEVNPLPPGMTLPSKGRTPAPHSGELPRNGFVSGRFTEQGQQVDYSFEAQAGELSLFDLATWGYARSWQSVAGIQILAADDTPLVTFERAGEAAYRSFLPFVAPHDGSYRYRLSARQEMFRYTVVRHSDYTEDDAGNLDCAGRDAVHGYLADVGDTRQIDLELEAGQEVALRVINDHRLARKRSDNRRRRATESALDPEPTTGGRGAEGAGAGRGAAGRGAPERGAPERGVTDAGAATGGSAEPESDFPDLVLTVMRDGQALTLAAPFAAFTATEGGAYQVLVSATSSGQGGLFVLELERSPPRVQVTGYVGNEDDDPVPGIRLRFLREPSSELIGETITDENGEFLLNVLPGRYSVHIAQEGQGVSEIVQANIDRDRELNLVWTR